MGNNNTTNKSNKILFDNKYLKFNLMISYPMREYKLITINNVTKICKSDFEDKQYVDLRNKCPPILNINNLPLHSISTVCSLLNYQLFQNKLIVFPPSRLFIYHNMCFFNNVKSLISFEMIFNSIKNFGFCSEIDYKYCEEHLKIKPSDSDYNIAETFKFIDIYRITNKLKLLKILLQNELPIIVTLILYNNIYEFIDRFYLPSIDDKRIGAIIGLIVGYLDNTKQFIVKFALGKSFGVSGYIYIPYEYILDKDLTPELFYLELNKIKIEGFINNKKKIISLEKNNDIYKKDNILDNFFN